MEWVTDRYHVVQLRMSRSDRDTPGKGCVTIAVRALNRTVKAWNPIAYSDCTHATCSGQP